MRGVTGDAPCAGAVQEGLTIWGELQWVIEVNDLESLMALVREVGCSGVVVCQEEAVPTLEIYDDWIE